MKALLDTNAFIWWFDAPQRLSPLALALCQDPANPLIISVLSLWEILFKQQIGKLQLSRPLAYIVEHQRQVNGLTVLPVELRHVLRVERLPLHHRYPFDRLLIAQALEEDVPVVTADGTFRQYGVSVVW